MAIFWSLDGDEMTTLRIDLTEYRPYIETLRDKLNENGVYEMSLTDTVKIAIEPLSLFNPKVNRPHRAAHASR